MKKSSTVTRLERQLTNLRREASDLRNATQTRENGMQNSFSTLVQAGWGGGGAQSDITSFDQIAYNNVYATISNNPMLLTFFYKSNAMMQAAIDMPIQDALRGGVDIESEGEMDPDDLKLLDDDLENTSFWHTIKQAEIWTQVYGGGGVIINTGDDPSKPLPSNLKGKPVTLYPANRWELSSPQRYSDYYSFYGQRIHGSRVLTMIGKEAPYILRWVVQNWGMSKVENLIEPLNIYLRTQTAVYDLLKEAKIDVYKFKRFSELLATNKGEQQALRRIQIMNMAKSNGNAIVLDAEDDFEQKQMTFAGLAAIWQENRINLASALRMPMTKLFGISAAGFSSGEDDIENYNGMIESEIRDHMRPMIRKLLDIKMLSVFGNTFDYSFKYKPLRMLGAVEEEAVKTSKHNRYLSLASSGYLNPQEFMQLEQRDGLVPMETEVSKGADPEMPLSMDGSGDDDQFGEKDNKSEATA